MTKPNAERVTSVRWVSGERHGDLRMQKAQFFTHPLILPFAGCLKGEDLLQRNTVKKNAVGLIETYLHD